MFFASYSDNQFSFISNELLLLLLKNYRHIASTKIKNR